MGEAKKKRKEEENPDWVLIAKNSKNRPQTYDMKQLFKDHFRVVMSNNATISDMMTFSNAFTINTYDMLEYLGIDFPFDRISFCYYVDFDTEDEYRAAKDYMDKMANLHTKQIVHIFENYTKVNKEHYEHTVTGTI